MSQYQEALYTGEDKNESEKAALSISLTKLLKNHFSSWIKRYCRVNKCITSKAAILVVVWSFITSLLYYRLFHSLDIELLSITKDKFFLSHFVMKAVVYLLFPLAGYMADNKFGRYKVVIVGLTLMIVAYLLVSFFLLFHQKHLSFSILMVALCLLSLVPIIFVNANIVQFGLDQLHDFPADHQSLFIHWHVWAWYVGSFVAKLENRVNKFNVSYVTLSLNVAAIGFICLTLLLAYYKKKWFLMNFAQVNPYKLVYDVTKFARQHKTQLQHSAFTYCEEDIPSRLDLGKKKYGGPFTTEQVEDVKTFHGILTIIVATGPSFILGLASKTRSSYLKHAALSKITSCSAIFTVLLFDSGLLIPLLVILEIPLYVCIISPFVHLRIPRMLTRIGIGMAFLVLSLLCELTMVSVIQARYGRPVNCRSNTMNDSALYVQLNSSELATEYYFIAANSLIVSTSNVLLTIALYELICSQCPHSMKGLLIGLTFASQGVFQGLGIVVNVPFLLAGNQSFFRCWMYYYMVNIGLGIVCIVIYICVARKYRFRQRDDPDPAGRHTEEYYPKFEKEYQSYNYH